MSFEIQTIPLNEFELIHLIDNSTHTQVEISTKGALLNSWQIISQTKALQLIQGNDFSKGWSNFEMNGFRGGKMSPFACRLEKGQYTLEDRTYTIEKFYHQKHALHGILYDALFTIESIKADEKGCYVHLKHYYNGVDKGFPFAYTILIKWHLYKENLLTVETLITNGSQTEIPMMDGWHPYFTLGGSIDDTYIRVKAKNKIEYDNNLLPTGNSINENEFATSKKISELHLDNCYLVDTTPSTCILENEHHQLIVQSILNYPYLQLYTPADRKSIAIENLSGIPNCFNNKIGLQLMKPQQSLTFKASYQFLTKPSLL